MDIFERLKEKHGDMKSACIALGFSEVSAWNWKNGKSRISKRHAEAIANDLGLSIKTVNISIHGKK